MALLTLDEAKTLLNITTDTYDFELPDYIAGAEEAVLFICGAAESTPVTEVVQASGAIALSKTPVLTVVSINGDNTGAAISGNYRVNLETGVIRMKANLAAFCEDTYEVVYTTGRTVTPSAMKQAAKIILKHQWTTLRRVPGRQQATQEDSSFVPGLGYAIPNAALQMLNPYSLGPAVG